MNKELTICLKVSETELNTIKEKALKHGLTVSAFLRLCALKFDI
jgi:predicted DNA binding CopG/RHH family protein